MKIAIIGAGAMGCLYGAYISKKHEVTMVDTYEPQVDAINKKGITIIEADGSECIYSDVQAIKSGTGRQSFDLVILFVKSNYTANALEDNKALIGKDTIVVTLQNGAGNDREIAKYAANGNIIIGTSKHNAVNMGNGTSRHPASGVTTIGSNSGNRETLNLVAEVLEQSGFEVFRSEDIQRVIWSKLFVNLSVNTLTAFTETPIGYMIRNKDAWHFAKKLIYEAVEVAEADGTYFDRREALEMVRKVCEEAGNGYSSMYQDKMKRIKTEIDAINGAIVEQAKLYGIATPYNSIVVDLMHAIEGAYSEGR